MSDSFKLAMTESTGPKKRAADDDMVTKRLRALSGQRGLLGCNAMTVIGTWSTGRDRREAGAVDQIPGRHRSTAAGQGAVRFRF